MTLALPSNPPATRQELPSFCTENAWLISAGATAFVVSAIAVALLFTPVGAGVVGMGILIGCAVMTGGAGFVAIGAIFYEYVGHQERCDSIRSDNAEIDRQEAEIDRWEKAVLSASSAMRKLFCCIQMKDEDRIAAWKGEVPLTIRDHGLLTHCQSYLTKAFNGIRNLIGYNFPCVVPHYLRFLFFGTDEQSPLVSLRPASIDTDEWEKLQPLVFGSTRYELAVQSGDKGYTIYNEAKEVVSTMEQDKQGISELIRLLKGHFATQPVCVREYFVLYSLYCCGFDPSNEIDQTVLQDCVPLFQPVFRRLAEDQLVRFLLIHAAELFPDEYTGILRLMGKSDAGQPGPSSSKPIPEGVMVTPLARNVEEFSKVQISLSAAMRAGGLCLIQQPERFTLGINHIPEELVKQYPILRSLPSDFSSLKLSYEAITGFLTYYFIRQASYHSHVNEAICYSAQIPLLPASMNGSVWDDVVALCGKVHRNEDSQGRESDKLQLIQVLREHFASQLLCVKEFICFLNHFGPRERWADRFYFDSYVTMSFLPAEGGGPLRSYRPDDSLLVSFIIANAQALFPEVHQDLAAAMKESAIEFPPHDGE